MFAFCKLRQLRAPTAAQAIFIVAIDIRRFQTRECACYKLACRSMCARQDIIYDTLHIHSLSLCFVCMNKFPLFAACKESSQHTKVVTASAGLREPAKRSLGEGRSKDKLAEYELVDVWLRVQDSGKGFCFS